MAYNASKEERTQLVDIKKNERGEHIIATKIKNTTSGSVSLDIRQYYTNDNNDVLPTQKGVRVNSELALELVVGLLGVLEPNELYDLADKIEEMTGDSDDFNYDSEMTGLNDDMPNM